MPVPPKRVPPGSTYNRRVVIHGGYRDVFPELIEPSCEQYEQAAE